MKNKYSIFSLIKHALTHHENWQRAWKDPAPKKEYDAIIIGGGGHGLATAYYLAKKHDMKNIAVVEKGWIGGGNTGRNTTIIRSNYLWDASAGLYDHALKIWEGLSQELNYNVMFSQRGVMNLAHNLQDVRDLKRRTHANRLNGIDAVYLNREEVKKFCPIINTSQDIRYPVLGGTLQRRAGTARHDAVAWGYARGADEMGVDIIQNCEVKGIKRNGDGVEGIETTKGFIKTNKIGVVAAGHSSVIANMAGLKLPLESKPLQALVSEPVKPVIDTVVMSNAVHAYVSQSDKGELVIGAGTDDYVSYSQKGSHDIVEGTLNAILDKCGIPILIYNIPGRSVIDMSVDTMARLYELKNIIGVKDATGDLNRVDQTLKKIGKDFLQLTGNDDNALEFNKRGGSGAISVTANIAPKLCSQFQALSVITDDRSKEEAKNLDNILQPLHSAMFVESNPSPVKFAAKQLGLCDDSVRLPLVQVTEPTKEIINKALKSTKLIK